MAAAASTDDTPARMARMDDTARMGVARMDDTVARTDDTGAVVAAAVEGTPVDGTAAEGMPVDGTAVGAGMPVGGTPADDTEHMVMA